MNYVLKYKDEDVLSFNQEEKQVQIINESLLPICLKNKPINYSLVEIFCSNRILLRGRENCNKILTECGLNIVGSSSVDICIDCKGLSFQDCYWIKDIVTLDTWETVNVFRNEFSNDLAELALTGQNYAMFGTDATCELTTKGSKAKGVFSTDDGLILAKKETDREIAAEIVTKCIADALGLECAEYRQDVVCGVKCSVCNLETSEDRELVLCRDYMTKNDEQMMYLDSGTYREFEEIAPFKFTKMQLFDYLTLNVDRNRDNFGILLREGRTSDLYPLFDHDGCYKERSVDAIYFPAGMTFKELINVLLARYHDLVLTTLINAREYLGSPTVQAAFSNLGFDAEYEGTMERLQYALDREKELQ